MLALLTSHVVLVIDHTVDEDLQTLLMRSLNNGTGIMVAVYRLQFPLDGLDQLYSDIYDHLESYTSAVYFIITAPKLSEDIVEMIRYEDLVRRNLLYMFYWREVKPTLNFKQHLIEAMRVCIVINRQPGTYQVYYSQAQPSGRSLLQLVNWWSARTGGLYRHPLLPPADKVYKDFNGRTFYIPVLHKPPWHFVTYNNDSIVVEGGRDDKLLQMLAVKLNFQIEYFDPPEKSQGSGIINGTMNGVLGQIWRRDVDLFMGDLTVTYNRSQAVEFSFLTLADNEAFLTHTPGRLNEALALVRSFHWEVWPLVIFTILVSGPLLFLIIYIPQLWNNEEPVVSPLKLFNDCNWFIYAIFLRQERPITNLEQLAEAMENQGYQLLVEKFSASHGNVENGTGLYKKIWQQMEKQKMYPLIESTEDGMKLVRDKKNVALIGGRETFFFDTRRFGVHNFHLSEKLYTRYSAIAMQLGCPFIDKFNQILMRLFEAGILTKITEEEYQNLGEKKWRESRRTQQEKEELSTSVAEGDDKLEEDDKLRPMSIKALQGGFFILMIGHCAAGILLLLELMVAHNRKCLGSKRESQKNPSKEDC
ncbi:ionotropic receptor 40a-like isoform X2 [Homalodisca vitripennis]|uniref:ionotropic receptor 40a-like isoform X2 n=1 Tax=Homalodisca vitripennis TaxID=197043 RepID=UPI001EEBE6C9|nr:ionotropic receptor 40a-like isoform X2 [Homalodisca vitripennis]